MIDGGVLVVDKPPGMTSHDVVKRIRRILKMKRVGHAGTLDPDARGVLVILLGKTTKKSASLSADVKKYRAEMTLGIETDTLDGSGQIVKSKEVKGINADKIREVFREFTGTITQRPPLISAVKVGGTPLYKLARRKPDIDIKPSERKIKIFKLEMLKMKDAKGKHPRVVFDVECSKGTYIRSLCADVGNRLGVGAHLSKLTRLASGRFSLEEAHSLEEIEKLVRNNQIAQALVEGEI